jgi:hypothetical protein
MVVATGATNIHKVFTPEQLPGILEAYMHGLRVTFLLALILSCIGVVYFPSEPTSKQRRRLAELLEARASSFLL